MWFEVIIIISNDELLLHRMTNIYAVLHGIKGTIIVMKFLVLKAT